jgi:hypothetical protein
LVGVLAALILGQFSNRLPEEGQIVLDDFVAQSYPDVLIKRVVYANNREQFTAEMGSHLDHAPKSTFRVSPVLYEGEIFKAPVERTEFAFPAQQVWCVTLTRSNNTTDLFYLARHENLYGATWVLYESRTGARPPQKLGCNIS